MELCKIYIGLKKILIGWRIDKWHLIIIKGCKQNHLICGIKTGMEQPLASLEVGVKMTMSTFTVVHLFHS